MIREVMSKVQEKKFKNGVFMSLSLDKHSEKIFSDYIKENLKGYKATPEPHLTLIFSKKPFDGEIKTKDYKATGVVKGFSIFGKEEKALVAEIESDVIVKRNKELVKKYGFIYDFPEFKPHITLVYGIPEDFDVSKLPEFPAPLIFRDETVKELDLKWIK